MLGVDPGQGEAATEILQRGLKDCGSETWQPPCALRAAGAMPLPRCGFHCQQSSFPTGNEPQSSRGILHLLVCFSSLLVQGFPFRKQPAVFPGLPLDTALQSRNILHPCLRESQLPDHTLSNQL